MPEVESDIHETIARVVGLLSRGRWWILGIACPIAIGTVAFSMLLPNRYSSEAILVAVQQQVSSRFVDGNNTAPSVEIQTMAREVLSRSRLATIINELGLYPDQRGVPVERLAERMQSEVAVEPIDDVGRNDFRSFRITYTAVDAKLAQATTSRLTSLFIEENLKNRGDRAARTDSFLTAQLDQVRSSLAEQEKRLEAFKVQNLGELPEQQASNFAALSDRRIQLQNTMSNLDRVQQQRSFLESQIEGRLASLQSDRSNLLIKFTPRHAEVLKKDQEIAKIQSFLDKVRIGSSVPAVGGVAPEDAAIAQWASQADALAVETQKLTQDQHRLESEIAGVQNRVNLSPLREQQLAAITRDYDLYKKQYSDLQASQLASQQTVKLEERQEGQQFRLIDPPTLPLSPSSPNRLKISLGGAGAGLFLGLALALIMDFRKNCFYREKEISRSWSLPLVLAVPLMLTPMEERNRTWRKVLETAAASVMLVAVVAVEYYVYRHG